MVRDLLSVRERTFQNFLDRAKNINLDTEHKGLFERLRTNRRVKQEVFAEALERYESHRDNYGSDSLSFLQWLLEHFDEILAMIQRIIALFP